MKRNARIGLVAIVALIAFLALREAYEPPPVLAGGFALGQMKGADGVVVAYRSATISKRSYRGDWPYERDDLVVICVPGTEWGRFFIAGRVLYAATGFAMAFSKRWDVTLDVDGVPQRPQEFAGAVGPILIDIDRHACG